MGQHAARTVLRHLRKLVADPAISQRLDQQLLQAFVAQRDESAFAELVRRHGPMVLDAARCVLHNLHDAEDVFQATFLVLTRKAGSIRKQSSVASWLYGVAYRLAMKARVSAAKRQTRQSIARLQSSAMDEMTWRELRLVLHEELHCLPEKYQAPLILCYFEGKTQDEAAQQLGWSKWTLKDRLERGRDLLRKRLTRRGLIPSGALFATLLSHDAVSAMPAALLDSTLNAGMLLATGQATTGAISGQAARLVEQGIRSLAFTKAKLAMTVFLAFGLIAAGAGLAAYQAAKDDPPQENQEPQQNPLAQNNRPALPPKESPARTDRYGDPLPPGALLRLGTVRFRGDVFAKIIYSPDGKMLASGHWDGLIRIWDPATGKILRTMREPDDAVYNIAFSPDGKILASTGEKTLYLWEVATGKEVRKIACPAIFVVQGVSLGTLRIGDALVFSPDSRMVAAVSTTKVTGAGWVPDAVRLWEVATGRERLKLALNEQPGICPAFTPDGKTLIVAGGEDNKDGIIQKWDAATGKSLGTIPVPKAGELNQETSWPYAISPDCRTLAVDCYGGIAIKVNGVDGMRYPGYKIRLLDLATGKERCRLRGQEDSIDAVCFSPDSKLIALTDKNSKVVVCDTNTGQQRFEIQGYPFKYRLTGHANLAFSPDGKTLASVESGNAVHFWDVGTGRELRANSETHHSEITRLVYSPDGKLLATGSNDQTVSLWDAVTGKHLFKLRDHEGRISGLAFSPDGKILASFGNWHYVYLSATATGKELQRFPVPDPQNGEELVGNVEPLSLAFTSDGKYLLGVGMDKKLRRWEVATGKRFPPQLVHLSGTEGPPDFSKSVNATGLSRDAKTAALGTGEAVYLVDVASGKELFKLKATGFSIPYGSLAFSGDGKWLVSGGSNNEFQLWEVATGGQVAKDLRSGNTYSATFSPDGRSVAVGVGSSRSAIHVVDIGTAKDRLNIPGEGSFVGALAFSPDGNRLAAGQRDSTVLIWDATLANRRDKLAEKDPDPKDLERLWAELAGADATKAYAAIWTLAGTPDKTLSYMKDRLPPVAKVKPERLRRLIADLDDRKFAVREEANKELIRLGTEAEPALSQALAATKSLEVRRRIEAILASPAPPKIESPDHLRRLRAIQVLEQIGRPGAVKILESLAEGAPGAWETQEAKASLERLSKR